MEKLLMQQLLLVFLAIHFPIVASQESNFEGWLNIDCGSEPPGVAGNNRSMPWSTDANFIKTGVNKQTPARQALEEMNTLRFFPDQTQENCYIVSVQYSDWSYIVRAGFLYGNYDNLSRAPTFDLNMDGRYWTTVNTSSVDDGVPLYQETIYYVGYVSKIKVCLVQTRKGEVPFISSLETMLVSDGLYTKMVPEATDPHAAFHLLTRTNFAGPEVRFGSGYWGDYYNRIWTRGATPKNCDNISTPPYSLNEFDNYPPMGVLNDSILTVNASDSIVLTVDLPPLDGPHPACFIFYFCTPNDTGFRATQIYIDGQMNTTITLPGLSSHVVTIYPIDVVGPTINITLAPAPNSTLSTLISGMEVFTKYDSPVPPPGSPVHHAPPLPAAASELLNLIMYAILSLALSLVFVF